MSWIKCTLQLIYIFHQITPVSIVVFRNNPLIPYSVLLPDIILGSRLVAFLLTLTLLKILPRIIYLQTLLYAKQREFIKGVRNKMPHEKLKELHEEIRKLHQELIVLRSKGL